MLPKRCEVQSVVGERKRFSWWVQGRDFRGGGKCWSLEGGGKKEEEGRRKRRKEGT